MITTSEYNCKEKKIDDALLVYDYCNFGYHLLLSIHFNLQPPPPNQRELPMHMTYYLYNWNSYIVFLHIVFMGQDLNTIYADHEEYFLGKKEI